MGCGASRGLRSFYEAFELGEIIGRGKFGDVFAAVERASRESYAVRIVERKSVSLKDLQKVGQLWRSLSKSKYIAEWFTIRIENHSYFVVMERCQCTLLEKLQSSHSWSTQNAAAAFRQMLRGLAWTHAAGVAHRNVKASNFLCGGDKGNVTIKLSDFDLACALPRNGVLTKRVGSVQYRSVEMLTGSGYACKTDVWSFGVMSYALLFGEFPYAPQERSSEKIMQVIQTQQGEPRFIRVPPDQKASEFLGPAARFCRLLLRRNPDTRCTAAEAQQLSFITGETSCLEMDGGSATNCNDVDRQVIAFDLDPPVGWDRDQIRHHFSADSERSNFSVLLVQKELPSVPLVKNLQP
eukprot:TRINITY_DN3623_c0_g1_i1.p1 TRINITY_DN3623_c0_g1~~TRINITY_DN3623_c0_g1_i1.p1  ORF type:complete len:362 (+),score=61.75 TRINITY_DN3623_c0_g1_i1:32-1087(+)